MADVSTAFFFIVEYMSVEYITFHYVLVLLLYNFFILLFINLLNDEDV